MSSPRVLVVEDDDFTRNLLINALRTQECDVVLESSSATYALKAATKMRIDAAVLDLNLGRGPTGLDLALGLRRNIPQIGIVFLTTYKDPRLIESNLPSLPEGAIYLNKMEMNSTSTIAMQISLAYLKPLAKRSFPWTRSGPLATMSTIQIEIMKEIAEGLSTTEIARSRGVTEQAIDKSISRISKHLGIPKSADTNQRVQIVRAYFENKGQGV